MPNALLPGTVQPVGPWNAMLGAYLAPAPNTTYGNILPIAQDNTTGALRLALPSALRSVGQGVLDLFDGPATGSMTPEATMALAALYGAGSPISSMGYEAPDEGGVVASRFVRSYNPPVKQPRPFEADYPNGASTDAEGNLVTDAEGRPLLGGYVAGRTVAGGADEAIPPAQYDQLAEALLGTRPAPVASRAIRGDSGRLVRTIDPQTGDNVYNIVFNKSLPPGVQDDTIAHELGHFIDRTAGVGYPPAIPQDGLKAELGQVYNTMNTGEERTRLLSTPQTMFGYTADQAPSELMAEAIRAYMADPNYLKTVAPKTSAAIRAAVNGNPKLAPIIQFNSMAPWLAGAGGAGAAWYLLPPDQRPGA